MEVHYVYQSTIDINDPVMRKVQEFCEYFRLTFKLRKFNSDEFEEDRDNITQLPAIQVYIQRYYEDTIYPNYQPIQSLHDLFCKFDIAEMERKAKKQIWNERIRYLKSKFSSLKTDSKTSRQTV